MRNAVSIWRPFEDLYDVARDFERSLTGFYPRNTSSGYLNVDVDVQEDVYIVKAEVPGLTEDNINISYENGVVSIQAEYKEEDGHVFRNGHYEKSFRLNDVNADAIEASLKDGILNIRLPKAEEAKARTIKIN